MLFRFTGGWDKYIRKLSPAARAKVLAASDTATHQASLLMVKEVRKRITAGGFAPNAALTIALKGSTKPLVNKGQLFQSVASQRVARARYFVGVLKKSGAYNVAAAIHEGNSIPVTEKMRRLFFMLWLVTKEASAKRAAKAARAAARKPARKAPKASKKRVMAKKPRGKRRDPLASLKSERARALGRLALKRKVTIFPLKASTKVIRIPSRPFIRVVFEDRAVMGQLRMLWTRAISNALRSA